MEHLNQSYKRDGYRKSFKSIAIFGSLLVMLIVAGCKKFIQIPPPITSTNATNVYTTDGDAAAVLTGIYANLSNGGTGSPQLLSMSVFLGLSADEFTLFNGNSNKSYLNYYRNQSDNNNASVTSDFWSNAYQIIYVTNAAISGLTNNTSLTPAVDKQLMGEAKFMRAFSYFYLVNLYGDVPLTTSTNASENARLSRTPAAQVYQQIVSDLKDAQTLLSDQYVDGTILSVTSDRTRPTKWAAAALLARVYLYTKDWKDAETEASMVIGNTGTYSLSPLNGAFLANSSEAIWQLQPVQQGTNSVEAILFIIPPTGISEMNPITLSAGLVGNFEQGDQRLTNWVGSFIDSTGSTPITRYYAYKYKANYGAPVTEYEMVLRLGEQFLIRAEAEAELGDFPDASVDLNMIRTRAGLPNTTASSQSTLLTAIQNERRVELFSEWGHRWLDLKRTGTVDAVMSVATPIKGGTWITSHQLYPIANYELVNDPNLKQNPGY